MVDFNKLLQQVRSKSIEPNNAAAVVTNSPVPPPPLNPSGPEKVSTAAAPILEEFDLGMDAAPQPEVKHTGMPVSATTTAAVAAPPAQEEPKGSEIEYPGLTDLRQRIFSLEESMKAKHPSMDSLLQTIHRNLDKDPELVHLLKPEETSILFKALQEKTQTKIVQEAVKSAKSGKNKGLSKITLDEL